MNQKKLLVVAAGLTVAAAAVYLLTRGHDVPATDSQGLIGAKRLAPASLVCATPIQSRTAKEFDTKGLDQELLQQLVRTGYRSAALPYGAPESVDEQARRSGCEAIVYTDLVEVKDREARLEYRLLLSGEQTPRLSAEARGKATDNTAALNQTAAGFQKPGKFAKPDPSVTRQQALQSALADLANQIQGAQAAGFSTRPPA